MATSLLLGSSPFVLFLALLSFLSVSWTAVVRFSAMKTSSKHQKTRKLTRHVLQVSLASNLRSLSSLRSLSDSYSFSYSLSHSTELTWPSSAPSSIPTTVEPSRSSTLPSRAPTVVPSSLPTFLPKSLPSASPTGTPVPSPAPLVSPPPTTQLPALPIEPARASDLTLDVPLTPLAPVLDCAMSGSPRTCTLTFGPVTYSSSTGTTFTTRGYQKTGGYMGGPIIRVRAGEIFKITLINALTADANYPAGSDINVIHHPNSTNIHTHGLHVSGQSPGDDIFTNIGPLSTTTYSYTLPPNHMPGMFIYHPHLHGSTSLQFGGGACGVLIVEDEPNSLPSQVLNMEDIILVLTFIETPKMVELQQQFNFALWQVTKQASMLLTNGQSSPSKSVSAGIWYRFRLVFAADQSIATLSFQTATGAAACEMQLLAKDGVMLTTAPRLISKAYLPAGGRAEIAVRCSNTGQVRLNANLAPAGTTQVKTFVALLLGVEASTTKSADITPFQVFRPCYLVDTSTVTPKTSLDLTLGTGNPNTKLNEQFFSSPDVSLNADDPFTLGTVGEVKLIQGTFVHVLHIHVNPYQITTLSPVIDTNYFRVGDWHDTLNVFLAQPAGSEQTVIRFWVDRYAGRAVVHCHMSTHEDAGMMNTYLITGVEGTTVDSAALGVDNTCYSAVSGQGYS